MTDFQIRESKVSFFFKPGRQIQSGGRPGVICMFYIPARVAETESLINLSPMCLSLFECASYILIHLSLTNTFSSTAAEQQLSVSSEKGRNCAQLTPEVFLYFCLGKWSCCQQLRILVVSYLV